jgi:hypothetical protein
VVIALIIKGAKKQENPPVETGKTEGETTVIEGKKLAETKNYKGLEVTNVKFKIDDTMTLLTADVYNSTSKDIEAQWININVLDENGKRITSLGGYIDEIKPGETTPIASSILSNGEDKKAYDIEITETREIITPEENNVEGQDMRKSSKLN